MGICWRTEPHFDARKPGDDGPLNGDIIRGKTVKGRDNRWFVFCGAAYGSIPKHDRYGTPVLQRTGGVRPTCNNPATEVEDAPEALPAITTAEVILKFKNMEY